MKNLIKLLSLLIALMLCLTACGGKEGGENGGDENEASGNGNSENTENENGNANNENTEPAEKNYFEQFYGRMDTGVSGMYSVASKTPTVFAKVKIDKLFDGVYRAAGGHNINAIIIDVSVVEDYYGSVDPGFKARLKICYEMFDDYTGEPEESFGNVSVDALKNFIMSHEYFLVHFLAEEEATDSYEIKYNDDGTFYFDYYWDEMKYITTSFNFTHYDIIPLTDDTIDLNSLNNFYKSEGAYEVMRTSKEIGGFEETFGHGTTLEEAAEKIRELYDFHVNVKDTIVFPEPPEGVDY